NLLHKWTFGTYGAPPGSPPANRGRCRATGHHQSPRWAHQPNRLSGPEFQGPEPCVRVIVMKSVTRVVTSTSVTMALGLSNSSRPPRRIRALPAETRCLRPVVPMNVTPDMSIVSPLLLADSVAIGDAITSAPTTSSFPVSTTLAVAPPSSTT